MIKSDIYIVYYHSYQWFYRLCKERRMELSAWCTDGL